VIGRSIYWHKYSRTGVFCEPFYAVKTGLESTKNVVA